MCVITVFNVRMVTDSINFYKDISSNAHLCRFNDNHHSYKCKHRLRLDDVKESENVITFSQMSFNTAYYLRFKG